VKQALQQGFSSRSRWLLQILGLITGMPRLACPVNPVKYLYGKEIATKYMRGYVWTNILGTNYLFNRVKCEVYSTRVRGEYHKVFDEFTLEASNAPLGAIDWNRCLLLHHLILHPARPFFYC